MVSESLPKVNKAVRVSPNCLTKPGSETVQSNCETYLAVNFIGAQRLQVLFFDCWMANHILDDNHTPKLVTYK